MWNEAYVIHNGQIGVKVSYLITDMNLKGESDPVVLAHNSSIKICSYDAIKKRAARTKGLRIRAGKGAGNETLYSFENIPEHWQLMCVTNFGDPYRILKETRPLERMYEIDHKASEFYATYKLPSGKELSNDLKTTYTINASVLNAVTQAMSKRLAYRKAFGNPNCSSVKSVWELVCEDVHSLQVKLGHSLKTKSLRRILLAYKKNGYPALISGKLENQNTAKVVTIEQLAVLEKLLRKHSNFDNMQISRIYGEVAEKLGWKAISEGTVAKYRKELDLYITAGNQGTSTLRNSRNMQVKRKAPNAPMVYWSVDGWDVELLYQSTGLNSEGKKVTTYHNRATCVVILDPYLNYPIGYAIGTHETTGLIREALRNAANHTKELFGQRFKSLQLQSDHYGKGVLVPIYEAMTKHYTPARIRNAKAKRIEPFFKEWNKELQLLHANWSGFGITSSKKCQPNSEYLDRIKHAFPDYAGVCKQIESSIEMRRMRLRNQYITRWNEMANIDHIPLTDQEYLYLFGEITGFTNKLNHDGLTITVNKQEYVYDSFDLAFRENRHLDWCVKFDRNDMSQVLVVNAHSKNGRLVKEISTIKFILQEKYIQPMALYDRKDGDIDQLSLVYQFNKSLEDTIIDRNIKHDSIVKQLFTQTPTLNGTLSKMILTDSLGQHKNQRNQIRKAEGAIQFEKHQKANTAHEELKLNKRREAYINEKINVNDFIS